MTDKKPLLTGDYNMHLNYINEDLAWGWKSWVEYDTPQYVFEVVLRDPETGEPVYVREKRVGDPAAQKSPVVVKELVGRLVKVLTDPEFQKEIFEYHRELKSAR